MHVPFIFAQHFLKWSISVIKVSFLTNLLPQTNLVVSVFFKPSCTSASLHTLRFFSYFSASMNGPPAQSPNWYWLAFEWLKVWWGCGRAWYKREMILSHGSVLSVTEQYICFQFLSHFTDCKASRTADVGIVLV